MKENTNIETMVNELEKIEQQGKRVLTTAQLAKCYGTESKIIANNFNRNKEHYKEGKHYIKLTGDELKTFKTIHHFDEQFKHTATAYLWTEWGILLHAKSLNTDKAWEVYEGLVEYYFRSQEHNKELEAVIGLLQNQVISLHEQISSLHLHTISQPDTYTQNIWKKHNATPKINELSELLHIESSSVYNIVYSHMSDNFGFNVVVAIREYKVTYNIADDEQISTITTISDSPIYRKQFTTSVNALIDNARFAQKIINPSDDNSTSEEQHSSIHFTTEDKFDDIITKLIDVLGYNPKCPAKLYSEIYGKITSKQGWKHLMTRHHCKSKKDVIIGSPKYKKKFIDVCNQLVSEN